MGVIEFCVVFTLSITFVFMLAKINDKKKYVFICMFVLFLAAALRHEGFETDTARYVMAYERYEKYTLKRMIEVYISGDIKDPTYYFTGWLFSRLFHDPQWWLVFIAAVFCGSTGRLIYKESKIPSLSIIALMALGYYSFSLTGLRQTIAIALVVISYDFIKRKELVPFILLVLAAGLYHKTSLIFLIAYPIAHVKLGKYHLIAAGIMFVVFFSFQSQLLAFMNTYMQEDRFADYLSGDASQATMSGFIIQAAIFVYAVFYYKSAIKDNEDILILHNLSFIGLMFQLYSSFIAEMFRVSMYFSIFNIVLIPNVSMCEEQKKTRILIQVALFGVLLIYMFKDGLHDYRFFWENIYR